MGFDSWEVIGLRQLRHAVAEVADTGKDEFLLNG